MEMTTEIVTATVLSAGNLVLLAFLAYVWIQNYRRFQTPLVLGLLAFSLVLVVENAVALWFFFSSGMLYVSDPFVERVVVVLRGLQFLALCFLAYVTWK